MMDSWHLRWQLLMSMLTVSLQSSTASLEAFQQQHLQSAVVLHQGQAVEKI